MALGHLNFQSLAMKPTSSVAKILVYCVKCDMPRFVSQQGKPLAELCSSCAQRSSLGRFIPGNSANLPYRGGITQGDLGIVAQRAYFSGRARAVHYRRKADYTDGQWKEILRVNSELRYLKLEQRAGRPRPDNCELCGEYCERYIGNGKPSELFFDHDHVTGKFRGWLCLQCNSMLGNAKDDVEILRKAINYLEAHSHGVSDS